jgi:hypothetical protein
MTGVVAQFLRFDKTFVLCSHPPKCVLFQRDVIKHPPFPNIRRDCLPIFPKLFSVTIGGMSVRRHQVPVSPAFALTEYKVLGWTYQKAVLDLSRQSQARGDNAEHQRYCSFNVQVSRLQSEEGVQLLQPLTIRDINYQMHPQLREEDRWLERLATLTMQLETNSSN